MRAVLTEKTGGDMWDSVSSTRLNQAPVSKNMVSRHVVGYLMLNVVEYFKR